MAVLAAPKRRQSAAWVFVPLAVAFLIIAGIAVYGIVSPYSTKQSPPAPGIRGSLVWGDGIFSNRAQLKAWLGIHGASYGAWAKTHPAALRLVKPRARPHTELAKAKAHKKPAVKRVAAAKVSNVQAIAPAKQRSTGIWLVVAFGLILGALSATPRHLLARAGVRVGPRERELRIAAIGAGAALLLGVIAATIVG